MTKIQFPNTKFQEGTVTPALIVITGAFITVIYGLLLLLTLQLDYSHRQVATDQALSIAEAGINYYKWHLAHDPDDFQDGTENQDPYVHNYTDPEGADVGEFSLEIIPPTDGSSIVTIKSTGKSDAYPQVERTITAQYGKASFAKYAFLNNASVWYGQGASVYGDIHSNNGIRMDGTNYGRVTSAREEYMCGSETGCSPPTQRPGVWGSGGDQSLWDFPIPPVDFDSVSFDFTNMKAAAQADGFYRGKSNADGYHVVFNSNGTFTLYRVTNTGYYDGYRVPGEGLGAEGQGGCRRRYQRITSQQNQGTFSVADNPIIFLEDDVWVEGTINGRTTLVAAGFPISSSLKTIWINGNVVYNTYDGSTSLGIIAQNDVLLVRNLPTNFILDGAIMAQKGQIIRHGYFSWCGGTTNAVRNSLTMNGALISYNKSYWNYGSAPDSGFITRTINYDSRLLYAPPPYFPTSDQYEFISWKEE